MTDDVKLSNCKMDNRGHVTCSIQKETFTEISNKGIKPRKVIFEMD